MRPRRGLGSQPAVRAIVSAGGTLALFAFTVLGLTTLATNVVKTLITLRQRRTAIDCYRCEGKRVKTCANCQGDCAVMLSPAYNPQVDRLAVCPVCAGTGEQKCFNCLGSGSVQPRKQ